MSTIELCDADSVAPARFEVFTRSGELLLCAHHYHVSALVFAERKLPWTHVPCGPVPALHWDPAPREDKEKENA